METGSATVAGASPSADWRRIFDLSVNAYWRGRIEDGRAACEWLLSLPALPTDVEEQARRNQVFYAPLLADLAASATTSDLAIPVRDGWSCFNPSIAATADGFRCIVRSSNYVLRTGAYDSLDPDGVIRTANYLADLGPDLELRSVVELADRTDPAALTDFPVAGFEDCRVFHWSGAWRAVATARNRNPNGICQQVLLTITGDAFVDAVALSDWRTGVHEKNWMPLVDGDDLRFVHSCDPTVVLAFDPARRVVEQVAVHPAPPIARRLRGGGQAVRVADGWLLLVHEGVDFEDGGRVYPHRFVLLDDAYRMVGLSPQFLFRERHVEYAAGLALRDGMLVASVGSRDRTAFLAALPLAEALATIAQPIDPATFDAAPLLAAAAELAGDAAPVVEAEPARADAGGATPAIDAGFTPFLLPDEAGIVVSTTLSGSSRDQIADALHSVVGWVDACLLIDTGIADDTVAVARAVAGEKLVVRSFPWRDDFAAARNAALGFAQELGATWAVTLDTDERILLNGLGIRAALASAEADLLHVRQDDGSYAKERFFRLPPAGMFIGPTHEAFVGARRVEELPTIRFAEVRKSEEGYRRKFERDAAILSRHTREHPEDPRWFYYLGDALQNLGRHEEAIAAYRSCWALDGWDEESAWAMYRAAECHIALGDNTAAIRACADGLVRHPGIAELPWLAAFAAYRDGAHRRAVAWASMSAALGCFEGIGDHWPRIGFTNPRARFEGPFDILRFALRALGDDAGADEAEIAYEDARADRLMRTGGEDSAESG